MIVFTVGMEDDELDFDDLSPIAVPVSEFDSRNPGFHYGHLQSILTELPDSVDISPANFRLSNDAKTDVDFAGLLHILLSKYNEQNKIIHHLHLDFGVGDYVAVVLGAALEDNAFGPVLHACSLTIHILEDTSFSHRFLRMFTAVHPVLKSLTFRLVSRNHVPLLYNIQREIWNKVRCDFFIADALRVVTDRASMYTLIDQFFVNNLCIIELGCGLIDAMLATMVSTLPAKCPRLTMLDLSRTFCVGPLTAQQLTVILSSETNLPNLLRVYIDGNRQPARRVLDLIISTKRSSLCVARRGNTEMFLEELIPSNSDHSCIDHAFCLAVGDGCDCLTANSKSANPSTCCVCLHSTDDASRRCLECAGSVCAADFTNTKLCSSCNATMLLSGKCDKTGHFPEFRLPAIFRIKRTASSARYIDEATGEMVHVTLPGEMILGSLLGRGVYGQVFRTDLYVKMQSGEKRWTDTMDAAIKIEVYNRGSIVSEVLAARQMCTGWFPHSRHKITNGMLSVYLAGGGHVATDIGSVPYTFCIYPRMAKTVSAYTDNLIRVADKYNNDHIRWSICGVYCWAMSQAYSYALNTSGFVHGDVTTNNILLPNDCKGMPVFALADWGLTCKADGPSALRMPTKRGPDAYQITCHMAYSTLIIVTNILSLARKVTGNNPKHNYELFYSSLLKMIDEVFALPLPATYPRQYCARSEDDVPRSSDSDDFESNMSTIEYLLVRLNQPYRRDKYIDTSRPDHNTLSARYEDARKMVRRFPEIYTRIARLWLRIGEFRHPVKGETMMYAAHHHFNYKKPSHKQS